MEQSYILLFALQVHLLQFRQVIGNSFSFIFLGYFFYCF